MGGAIKSIGNAFKSVVSSVTQMAGPLLKTFAGNLFSMGSMFARALSPIAPNFFNKIDQKIQQLAPRVNQAIDRGVNFANNFANRVAQTAGQVGDAVTNIQGAVANVVPQVRALGNLNF